MTVENRPVGGPQAGSSTTPVHTPAERTDAAGPVQVKGEYNGREVAVHEDAHSAIADSAEELTFSLADTVERKIFDRKIAKKEGQGQISQSEQAKAEFMSKKLKGMDPEVLKRLLGRVRQERPKSASDLRQMAKQEFPDSSARHLALEYLRECVAEADDDPELLALIDTALIAMEEEEGPAIRAGYNIDAVPLTEFAGPDQHREVYRENVLSFRNAGSTFSDILRQYGEDGVEPMLDYISDSLSVDMESLSPSLEPERLAIVNDGLATARGLINTLGDARDLVRSTGCDKGRRSAKAAELATTLMDVKDGKISSGVELKMRLPLLEKANPTRDVELLTGFIAMARRIPDRLYRDGTARQNALDVIQSALDEAVELEEKILDGLE